MATVNVIPVGFDTGAVQLGPSNSGVGVKAFPEVWPFLASTLTEELQWLTDPLGSRTGEQRIALRKAPRQIFSYGMLLTQEEYSHSKRILRERGVGLIGFPIWSEAVQINVTVNSGDTSVSFDTSTADWRAGDMIVLWKGDQRIQKLVATVNPAGLDFFGEVGEEIVNPEVVPVRRCLFTDGLSFDRLPEYASVRAGFLVVDNVDLSSEWSSDFPQYLSLDVITERPEMVKPLSDKIVRSAEVVDNQLGLVHYEEVKDYIDYGQMLGFLDERPTQLWRRRLWLHSLHGKQKTFWLPSFNNDLRLMATNNGVSTTLSVKSLGLATAPSPTYTGKHIMIELKDGTRYFRQISSATEGSGGNDNIVVSSAFGASVAPANIAIFSFMSKMRFDSDSIEFEHMPNALTLTAIPAVEVPA